MRLGRIIAGPDIYFAERSGNKQQRSPRPGTGCCGRTEDAEMKHHCIWAALASSFSVVHGFSSLLHHPASVDGAGTTCLSLCQQRDYSGESGSVDEGTTSLSLCQQRDYSGDSGSVDDSLVESRRSFLTVALSSSSTLVLSPLQAIADGEPSVIATPTGDGDLKKLFGEGQALEAQGNILAAQRIYTKATKIAPRFIYAWANLANTLVAQGDLSNADEAYTTAISLCEQNLSEVEPSFGTKRCDDLYLLLLNRGSVRLNNGKPSEALVDLSKSNDLRGRPDSVILENLARAQEINSYYGLADRNYSTAISMTANEVAPFWLRSSMVKFQQGDLTGAFDLARRVENRFPEAPEVRACYACLLLAKGDEDAARRKYLEIPDRPRLKYSDRDYVDRVITWPPAMKEKLAQLTKAVGDTN